MTKTENAKGLLLKRAEVNTKSLFKMICLMIGCGPIQFKEKYFFSKYNIFHFLKYF